MLVSAMVVVALIPFGAKQSDNLLVYRIIGHHLPEEQLSAFLARCKAVVAEQGSATKEGAAAAQALSDYSANTLGMMSPSCMRRMSRDKLRNYTPSLCRISGAGEDNLGFQMLKGLGWTQGYAVSLRTHTPSMHSVLVAYTWQARCELLVTQCRAGLGAKSDGIAAPVGVGGSSGGTGIGMTSAQSTEVEAGCVTAEPHAICSASVIECSRP